MKISVNHYESTFSKAQIEKQKENKYDFAQFV